DAQRVASAPPQSAGRTVDVTVTTPAGTSAATPADRYTYTLPPWEDFGGALASSPVATSMGSPTVDAFMAGTDGALWHRWFDASRAWNWESLGGQIGRASCRERVGRGVGAGTGSGSAQ